MTSENYQDCKDLLDRWEESTKGTLVLHLTNGEVLEFHSSNVTTDAFEDMVFIYVGLNSKHIPYSLIEYIEFQYEKDAQIIKW